MASWEEIENMYRIAAGREGTPYEQFGRNMLDLIQFIKDDAALSHLNPATAMWTLLLSSSHNRHQSIHISWTDGKFVVFLTHKEQEEQEGPLEKAVEIIRDYAKAL